MTLRWLQLTLLGLFIGLVGIQAGNDFQQRQLTMDEGMPSNSVRTILQDQRGFVWMGTENGLCRYDGQSFYNYKLPEKAGLRITAMLTVGKTDLYIGTNKGVYRLSLVTEQAEELPLGLTFPVSAMMLDQDGRLWISTKGEGILCYKADEEKPFRQAMTECNGVVNQVYADANNQIWALCSQGEGGLWRLDKTKDRFEPVAVTAQQSLPTDLTCMIQTSDGRRWLGTSEHGLWQLTDDNQMVSIPAPATGHNLHIHALIEQSQHQLLVCSDDGLWLFDTASLTSTLRLPQRFVYTAMCDNEGGLWVGTYYGGVSYVSPIAQRFNASPGGLIARFAQDRHGRIWMAGDEGGISCYQQGKRLANYPGQQRLQQLNVHALCLDGDDLWIGTYSDGVYVLDTQNGKLRQYQSKGDDPQSLYDPNSYAIFRDSRGRMWVATTEGLCRYSREKGCFERIAKLGSVAVDMDEDPEGNLWISTQGAGLFRLSPDGKTKSYRHQSKDTTTLTNDIVNCTLIDPEGKMWIGTQGGLCRYHPQTDKFSHVRLDVPREAIASIVSDQGVLWLSGDCGILKYNPKEGIQRFTRHDGLVSEQFLPNSVLKANDGCIYFGTISGFNSFYPYQIKVNQQLPPVFITRLEIGTSIIPVGNWRLPESLTDIEQLDLYAHNAPVFSLAFASLSYCSPEKNIYAYMLEGFDKQWNYVTGGQKATYTNLPAGTYTFKVRATNNDGIWSDQEARLKVVIHPPYWLTTYAKIAYVLLFIGLVWGFIWLRLKLNDRRHRHELAALNEQKEREMQQARMDFFTTIAHEIRTPVSLIIAPLDQLKAQLGTNPSTPLDIIDRNAHRLLDLVNQLLDFRKLDQQPEMRFSTQDITQLLTNVANDFAPSFNSQSREFAVSLPNKPVKAAIDAEAITKAVSNLLSNANKYARNRITLTARKNPDGRSITIEVSDDGRGISQESIPRLFEPFYQVAHSKPGTGIGLSIVKRVVEAHHGTVSVDSTPGEGTTFRIWLPTAQETTGEESSTPRPDSLSTKQAEPGSPTIEKKRMLIIDDNEDMLTFLVTTFMDEYDVTAAHDGEEALQLVSDSLVGRNGKAATAFDIVISDWMMEHMDGPTLCHRLRQNPATRQLPFILLTAKTDSQSKIKAMELGIDAFIEKPFNVKYLEACIKNLLNRSNQ